MSLPSTLKFTSSHEWVRLENDGSITVGITDHAQEQLGDIVFVEPPSLGRMLKAGEACGVVESVKAASDIYAPLSGEVVAVNGELDSAPEKINAAAHETWMFRMKPTDKSDLSGLLDASAYGKLVGSGAG
ncbi:MAG: glycine cleavage system protein GcvH [Burkholderiales bacterium]